jgi:hypothetical protein
MFGVQRESPFLQATALHPGDKQAGYAIMSPYVNRHIPKNPKPPKKISTGLPKNSIGIDP